MRSPVSPVRCCRTWSAADGAFSLVHMQTESIASIYRWIGRIAALSAGEKVCLKYLAALHVKYGGGPIYPSMATVARKSGVSLRTANRYIKLFCGLGLLKVIQGRRGRSSTVLYRFMEDRIFAACGDPSAAFSAAKIRVAQQGRKCASLSASKCVKNVPQNVPKMCLIGTVLRERVPLTPVPTCTVPNTPTQVEDAEDMQTMDGDWTVEVPDDWEQHTQGGVH